MNRLVTALIASATFLTLATPSFAQTSMSSPSAMKAPMAKATPSMMKSTKSCPKGESYVKGYTKSNGTKVKGYCRKAM